MSDSKQRGGNDAPMIFIEGLEEKTKRDLAKHKKLIEQTHTELSSYRQARSHEVQRKKRWGKLIGGGKFNDDALRESMKQSAVNIRHFSDKCDAAEEKLKHHQLIVDTLSTQLEQHNENMRQLNRLRASKRAANGSGS